MYRPEWWNDVATSFPAFVEDGYIRNILDIALDVHMTAKGSYDRGKECQEKDAKAIKWVLENWQEDNHGKEFSNIVKQLLECSIKEYDEEKLNG